VLAEADVNPATFSSILFERPSGKVQREDPSMFRDLKLDPRYRKERWYLDASRRRPYLPAAVGEPLPASHGQDLYQQVFGAADQTQAADQTRAAQV
jgi:hypothetical protein